MLEIMALRAPVSPRPLAVTPERAAWLQRVAFALQVLLAARSGIPSPHGIAPERAASQQRVAVTTQLAMVTKDTTVRLSACDEDTFLFIHLTYLYNRRKRKKFSTVVSGRDRESSRAPLSTDGWALGWVCIFLKMAL